MSFVVPRKVERRARRRSARSWLKVLSGTLLVIVVVLYLLPLAYMLGTSFKTGLEIAQSPLALPRQLTFENYAQAIKQMNYVRAVANTVGITAASTVLIVVLAGLAAYPLARLSTRWTNTLYQYFLIGLSIPGFVVLIPLYTLMKTLGLVNTYTGIVLIYAASNLPFSIFFFTSFIRSIPRELEEAAAIDGCSPAQVYWFVVLPLLKPVTGTVAMFVTLAIWNDFVLPSVFLFSPQARTIMVAVYSFLGYHGYDPASLFPAAVLGSLPLLVFFFFLQRQIIAGIAAGAVKG